INGNDAGVTTDTITIVTDGTYAVTVKDGNCQASDDAVVTVLTDCQGQGCTATCPPDHLNLPCGASLDPADTGSVTCQGDTDQEICDSSYQDSIDYGCGGTLTVKRTWFCTQHNTGLYSKCVQTLTIVDNPGPSIPCPNDATVECGSDTSPASTGTP